MSAKTIQEKQEDFLSSPHFAVVGASKDRTRWATKVLQWYKDRHLDVTPVHPREKELEGINTVATISDLPNPSKTSTSIITRPVVTLGLLQQAKDLSVPAIWLQPGAEDASVISYINDNGLADRVVYGGPCILKEGDSVRESSMRFEETYREWAC